MDVTPPKVEPVERVSDRVDETHSAGSVAGGDEDGGLVSAGVGGGHHGLIIEELDAGLLQLELRAWGGGGVRKMRQFSTLCYCPDLTSCPRRPIWRPGTESDSMPPSTPGGREERVRGSRGRAERRRGRDRGRAQGRALWVKAAYMGDILSIFCRVSGGAYV